MTDRHPLPPALSPEAARKITAGMRDALRVLNDPESTARRMATARSFGVGGLLPPLDHHQPMTFADALDTMVEERPDMATMLLRAEERGAARERLRQYVLARDAFYGREMLDEDVIDEHDGHLLLMSDLRRLAEVETYTDDEGFPASRPMETP